MLLSKSYAVFDRDDHKTYHEALKLAESLNQKLRNDEKQPVVFQAITSIPSFELWFLLHFEDIQHHLHRDKVMSRLKKYMRGYDKGSDNCFEKTRKHLDIARNRARRLFQNSNAYDDKNLYTTVFNLVDLLINLGNLQK